MPDLKPAYLIFGEDHGALAERRARLRALVEGEGDSTSVELLEGDCATPAAVAQALAAMTLTVGRRVIIVDGVERWKQAEVEQHLTGAMNAMPPLTTLALFAREEGRTKAPIAVHDAVKGAGGQLVAQKTVKPWELPRWVSEQASQMGISLDSAGAKALVEQVGERPQRLRRELEKLALEADFSCDVSWRVGVEEIELRAAHSAERRAFTLADALLAADKRAATLSYLRLRRQGERLSGLTYLMAQRLRDALAVALRLQAGESVAEIKRELRMPPRAAERFVADVARTEPARLRKALGVLADLELDSRGGSQVRAAGASTSSLQEDTIALRAIEAIAG